jgi:large subunit ribosomal protein L9
VEVILLETVRNLGALGDKVKVKPGYARNGLIPQGKAVYANEANIAKFEKRRAELEKAAAERHAKALERQAALEKIGSITIVAKAGDEGKLFGSIGIRDITAALNAAGADIEKRQVNLSEGTLRMTGEYEVTIELESDVVAILKVNIVPQG